MVKFYRRAFSTSDLWVTANDQLSDFYASSWQRGDSPVPLLIIRLLLTAIALAVLIWSIIEARSFYWLIFLTNWGFLLITLMLVNGSVVSIYATSKRNYESEDSVIPWYVSSYWLLFNCSVPVAFLITALYWGLLYDNELKKESIRFFWLEVSTHAFNSCIAFIEVVTSRTPVRLLHMYQPLGLGIWYTVFTVIYYFAGGTDSEGNPFIYEILDWRETMRSLIIVIISLVGLLAIYTALWGFAIGRDKLTGSIFRTTSHNLPYTPPEPDLANDIPRFIV